MEGKLIEPLESLIDLVTEEAGVPRSWAYQNAHRFPRYRIGKYWKGRRSEVRATVTAWRREPK